VVVRFIDRPNVDRLGFGRDFERRGFGVPLADDGGDIGPLGFPNEFAGRLANVERTTVVPVRIAAKKGREGRARVHQNADSLRVPSLRVTSLEDGRLEG